MGKIIISSEMDKGLYGYARYPNIYVNKRIVRYKKLYKKTVTHERIHLAQQRQLLVLPFYIWYVLEYFFITASPVTPLRPTAGSVLKRNAIGMRIIPDTSPNGFPITIFSHGKSLLKRHQGVKSPG